MSSSSSSVSTSESACRRSARLSRVSSADGGQGCGREQLEDDDLSRTHEGQKVADPVKGCGLSSSLSVISCLRRGKVWKEVK